MKLKYASALVLASALLGACQGTGYNIDQYSQPAPMGVPLGLSGHVAPETHGRIAELPYFSNTDVPARPQVHRKTSAEPTIGLAVESNLGYLDVDVIYPPFGHVTYTAGGRGHAIPLSVKIEAPFHPSTLVPRKSNRRYTPENARQFSNPIYNERNRTQAILLAKEVLAKTHCRGGTVTEDERAGGFVEVYGRKSRTASGILIIPGWSIKLRCSRWRSVR